MAAVLPEVPVSSEFKDFFLGILANVCISALSSSTQLRLDKLKLNFDVMSLTLFYLIPSSLRLPIAPCQQERLMPVISD